MILPWRPVQIGDGPAISTSLTAAETDALRELARGRVVLEVGSAYGYSTIVMAQVADHVFSIDPHSGYGALPDSLNVMRQNIHAYDVADKVTIMIGHSQPAMWALARGGATFDLIFIDGDHRAEAVTADITNAILLSEDGPCVRAVHDYGEETCPDVKVAVDRTSHRVAIRAHARAHDRLVDSLAIWDY